MTTGRAGLVYCAGLALLQSAALLAEQSAAAQRQSGIGELLRHPYFSLIVFGALAGGFAEMLAGFQVSWLESPRTWYSVVARLCSAWLMGITALPFFFEQYWPNASGPAVFFFSAVSAGVIPQAWVSVRALLANFVRRGIEQEERKRDQ